MTLSFCSARRPGWRWLQRIRLQNPISVLGYPVRARSPVKPCLLCELCMPFAPRTSVPPRANLTTYWPQFWTGCFYVAGFLVLFVVALGARTARLAKNYQVRARGRLLAA